MKSKRHLTEIRVLLVVSVLVSVLVPLQVQAASQVPANDPPYVIRGHIVTTQPSAPRWSQTAVLGQNKTQPGAPRRSQTAVLGQPRVIVSTRGARAALFYYTGPERGCTRQKSRVCDPLRA